MGGEWGRRKREWSGESLYQQNHIMVNNKKGKTKPWSHIIEPFIFSSLNHNSSLYLLCKILSKFMSWKYFPSCYKLYFHLLYGSFWWSSAYIFFSFCASPSLFRLCSFSFLRNFTFGACIVFAMIPFISVTAAVMSFLSFLIFVTCFFSTHFMDFIYYVPLVLLLLPVFEGRCLGNVSEFFLPFKT